MTIEILRQLLQCLELAKTSTKHHTPTETKKDQIDGHYAHEKICFVFILEYSKHSDHLHPPPPPPPPPPLPPLPLPPLPPPSPPRSAPDATPASYHCTASTPLNSPCVRRRPLGFVRNFNCPRTTTTPTSARPCRTNCVPLFKPVATNTNGSNCPRCNHCQLRISTNTSRPTCT